MNEDKVPEKILGFIQDIIQGIIKVTWNLTVGNLYKICSYCFLQWEERHLEEIDCGKILRIVAVFQKFFPITQFDAKLIVDQFKKFSAEEECSKKKAFLILYCEMCTVIENINNISDQIRSLHYPETNYKIRYHLKELHKLYQPIKSSVGSLNLKYTYDKYSQLLIFKNKAGTFDIDKVILQNQESGGYDLAIFKTEVNKLKENLQRLCNIEGWYNPLNRHLLLKVCLAIAISFLITSLYLILNWLLSHIS